MKTDISIFFLVTLNPCVLLFRNRPPTLTNSVSALAVCLLKTGKFKPLSVVFCPEI